MLSQGEAILSHAHNGLFAAIDCICHDLLELSIKVMTELNSFESVRFNSPGPHMRSTSVNLWRHDILVGLV